MTQCSTSAQCTICVPLPVPFLGSFAVIGVELPGGCGCGTSCDESAGGGMLSVNDSGCIPGNQQACDQPFTAFGSRLDDLPIFRQPPPESGGHLSGCG